MKNEPSQITENIVSTVCLIPVNKLKPIEKVFPTHLDYIKKQIEKAGFINQPLIIDKKYFMILDGSHRYAYLKNNGYKYAPVIMVDYDSDLVGLGSNLIHRFINKKESTISKQEIINNILNNKLLNPRTTRHFFSFRKEKSPIALEDLIKGETTNIDYLISNSTIHSEINNNQNYIEEINNELKLINSYINEQVEVKNYLKNQIKNMQNNIS